MGRKDRSVQQQESHRRVSIIIPVYGAFDYTLACLQSVLKHTDLAHSAQVFLIDDRAPIGDLATFLAGKIALPPQVVILRNPKNLGFVASCNRAIQECGEDDVLLLNSDTEVTPRWLEKMRRAAYGNTDIGTVTPLTNNGVICSFPNFCEDNDLPDGLELDEYADLVEAAAMPYYHTLPTAVGFCMFIKREVIAKVGLLDEENFGQGYGEENDFCCRAQSIGYRDILDDSTFVYHKGSMSFKESKKELCERNSKILEGKHPHYFGNVSAFCGANPLREVRERIFDHLLLRVAAGKRGTLLHIIHNGPYKQHYHTLGGTELHVQDLIAKCPDFNHWSMVCDARGFFLTAHLYGFSREFFFDAAHNSLAKVITSKAFDFIHVHHTRGFPFKELVAALKKHGNYVVSLHDFFTVCPRINLMRPDLTMCNGHECTSTCGYEEKVITELREQAQILLSNAKRTFAFSRSTKSLYFNIIADDSNFTVNPHGLAYKSTDEDLERYIQGGPARPGIESPLKILILGHVAPHKGSRLLAELSTVKQLSNGVPLEWHLLGKFHGVGDCEMIEHGEYTREEVTEKISEINPHLSVMLAVCPETYSLSVDETLNAGVPVLSSPFGAPAERIRASGAGWVLTVVSKEAVLNVLSQVSENWMDYWIVRQNVRRSVILSTEEMARGYLTEYRASTGQKLQPAHEILNIIGRTAMHAEFSKLSALAS
jgi:GT2 family glycosyltransferase/glycosyltransferase involved in cell wall biosynthesis